MNFKNNGQKIFYWGIYKFSRISENKLFFIWLNISLPAIAFQNKVLQIQEQNYNYWKTTKYYTNWIKHRTVIHQTDIALKLTYIKIRLFRNCCLINYTICINLNCFRNDKWFCFTKKNHVSRVVNIDLIMAHTKDCPTHIFNKNSC